MNTGTPKPRGSSASREADALAGKVALVTGGSRGIGFAIAEGFVARGMKVAIAGRKQADLDAARARLGGDAAAVAADARSADDVDRAVASVADRFGGLDVLINNAGVGVFKPVAEMSSAEWQTVIETNLSGVFNFTRAAIPHLRRRGGGWIINISSLAGKNPFSGGAAYCASKAGLNAFSEALMQEVRYDDIRVSYVMPGSVATGFGGRGAAAAADWKIQPQDVAEVVIDLLLMPPRSLPSRVELRPSKPAK